MPERKRFFSTDVFPKSPHIVLIPDAPLYGFRYAEFDFQNSFHCFPWSSIVILREETFLVLWISSVLNPVELKVASYRAASKLHYKYFSLIFNRFVTKLLFLTKASLMQWRWSIGDGELASWRAGTLQNGKWPQHIPPDVSCLDPTLIRTDPPFWSI